MNWQGYCQSFGCNQSKNYLNDGCAGGVGTIKKFQSKLKLPGKFLIEDGMDVKYFCNQLYLISLMAGWDARNNTHSADRR